jgi:competence protein ComFC
MNLYNIILNIVFPIHCAYCNKKSVAHICKDCLEKISFCKNKYQDIIFSAFSYKNPIIKKVLWALKFDGKKEIASILSHKAYDVFLDEIEHLSLFKNLTNIILVPIPLHKKRYKMRGFNQAELIAISLFRKNPSVFSINTKNLIRIKNTNPQAKIKNRSERYTNISQSFDVLNPEIFKNKNIILIDDITTTGATLLEAKKILEKSGAKNVYGFTLAQ